MVLGALTALACVAAIGAATVLLFLAQEATEPAGAVATSNGDCSVVAWTSGSVHCLRTVASAETSAAISVSPPAVLRAREKH